MGVRRLRPSSTKGYKNNDTKTCPIVGIGASAGGLEALTLLLNHLPIDTGFGFVLVQHLDPEHESALTKLLARATTLPVTEITNNLPVEPNHVYVIPPNASLRIHQGVLTLQPRPLTRVPHHPIDFFLESLAEDCQDRAIGVILSGTATDGTLGLETIKGQGGITFAQDGSARYDSMPRSAIASGSVDFVLSPEDIAKELGRIARHPYVAAPAVVFPNQHEELKPRAPSRPSRKGRTASTATHAPRDAAVEEKPREDGFRSILVLLRSHSGVDFSLYKSTTIQRRITRRMVVNKMNTPEDYVAFLRSDARELEALYADMLISVTGFFRNPEAFDILKRKVFPRLLQQRGDDPIRVWVLGCSTGQEAYSIAMVFAEASDKAPRPRKLQVFATDLNDALLDKARHGVYARNLTQEVTPERLRRFFVEEEGGYRVSKSLREMVIFARQNLINDPPFSRIDLITCRNLMIYLEPSLQRKAIPAFHYALKPEGFLFLGASESVGGFTDLFEPFDKTHRIYSRKAAPPRLFQLPVKANPVERTSATPARKASQSLSAAAGRQTTESFRGEISPEREADRVAVSRFAPCGVLINADLQVLQFRGTTDAYLQHPTGKASFDVLKMAREGLMLPLRATINKAKKEDRIVRREGIRLPQGNRTRIADIEVIPLRNLKERCFLVVFEETDVKKPGSVFSEPPETRGKTAGPGKEAARRIAELESELKETREYLQSIHERQEAANEELQASNEEVQSANEELQSVNEELETSKEELESANEELTTINEEMSSRNLELNRLNSDLVNIQTSARLPIVLLGRDLTIRRFSAQAERQFNLLAADVGRPFSHVRHNLMWDAEQKSGADIDSFIADVIASVQEREREVRNTDGRWYSLRVRPYLTVDNKVDGAVLVLVDISDLKRTEQAIAGARDFSEAIIRTVRDPLLILSADLRVHMANDAFYKTFHVHPEESSGRRIFELGNHQWNIPKLRQLLEEILPRKSFFDDFEVTHEFESIGRRTMLLNARQLTIPGQPERILLGIQDVTEALSFQTAAREDAEKFKVLFERSPLPKWTLDPKTLSFLNVNYAAVEHYGYSHEEFLQMTLLDVLTEEARESLQTEPDRIPSRLPERAIYQHKKKNGEVIDVDVRVNEITIAGKLAWLASNNDITELQRAEQALKALNETLTTELASTRQLQETSTQLIVEDVPESLFQQALNAAVTIMHSDMASIQMVDEERDALRLLASRGFEPDFDHTFKWVRRDTQTSCSVSWQERHRVIVPDVETWEYLVDDQALEDHRKAGIRGVQSTPLISRNGRIIGVISTHWRNPYEPQESALRLIDILARQAADLIERNKAEAALREADRRKNEFIAVLAHELRNPLSPIRSALEIIQHTGSTVEDVHAATAMMERQIGQVVRLVDDLLDMSRISRGKVELRKEPIDLALVINQAVEAIQTHVKSKELQLAITLPPDPIYVHAESVRLGQVVVNLLNNACKFTDKGGNIWLTAAIENSRGNVLIKVRDSGIGIDPSEIHRIFEMFTQVKGPMQRTQGGLGIGLALTKNLVELHGGELHAHSDGPGKGSEFVVRLPMLNESSLPAEPVVDESTPAIRRRVLVVDDNIDSVESLSMLLRMAGNETCTANDGDEAINAADTFRPDVVLMDIGLPNLNGYDAARRIREQPWGKQMMLVALTGWGQDEDRQRSRDAGFDSHLVKPVDYATLTKLLNRSNGG